MKKALPKIRIVSGVAAGGKGTAYRKLLVLRPECLRLVSFTTRPIRPTELNGREYFFVTKDTFLRKVKAGEMFEYEEIWSHYYGTPVETFLKAAKQKQPLLAEVDVRGVEKLYRRFADVKGVFLDCNVDDQRHRFRERGMSLETMDERLEGSYKERLIAKELNKKYPKEYLLINTTPLAPSETLKLVDDFLFK